MPEILFDAEAHRYTVDGIVRPSVTQILGAAGLVDTDWFTAAACLRGRVVHQACHYMLEQDLDEHWLETSPYAGYLRAAATFMQEARLRTELVEHRVFHEQLGYCGMLDLTASRETARLLVDWKTGGPYGWHGMQTTAYSACFEHPRKFHRMTVHLRADGKYSVTEHRAADFTQDWRDFQAALVIWQRKNRKEKPNGSSDRTTSVAAA
jgi:hypothetical protein